MSLESHVYDAYWTDYFTTQSNPVTYDNLTDGNVACRKARSERDNILSWVRLQIQL